MIVNRRSDLGPATAWTSTATSRTFFPFTVERDGRVVAGFTRRADAATFAEGVTDAVVVTNTP
jgi:hypothetical protein